MPSHLNSLPDRYPGIGIRFFGTTDNGWAATYDTVRGIRTDEFRFLRNPWPNGYGPSERTRKTEVELYDLREVLHETENVADEAAYVPVRGELYERFWARLNHDGDPALDGPISPKQGAFCVHF